MLTEKENYLKVYKREKPEWVPRMFYASPGRPAACTKVVPSFLNARRVGFAGFDIWGVEYVGVREMSGQALPVPGKFLIPDITKWREILKAPDLSGIDWEKMARKDMAHIDRTQTAVMAGLHSGYFQALVNMMGYVEGCCALYEEPEEVKAMLEYMSNFYCEVERNVMKYYKPDIWSIVDDCSTARSPFISVEQYREFIKPFAAREASIAKEAGVYVDMHCCGSCACFIDDWLEMGVSSWQPAQVMNDLEGIRKKYGDKLAFIGCWDSQGPAGWLGSDEALVKQAVRDCIDRYARDGLFIFWASTYGDPDDPAFQQQTRWIQEEYDAYGRTFYQKSQTS